MRERLVGVAPFEVSPEQPRYVVFDHRGRHAAYNRLADRRGLAPPAPPTNVESLDRLAPGGPARGSAAGRALQPDIAGPVLRARMRAPVEIQLETPALLAELIPQPLDDCRELGLGRSDGVVAMRIADASDRRRIEAVRIQRETDRANLRDD